MKHKFTVQRYYCSYCDVFRIKQLFYNNKLFLKDKNNKTICIYCWKLELHIKNVWYEKKKGSTNMIKNEIIQHTCDTCHNTSSFANRTCNQCFSNLIKDGKYEKCNMK